MSRRTDRCPCFASPLLGQPDQVLAADRLAVEGSHTTLYGTALVMNRPREVVVRRCSAHVRVDQLVEPLPETSQAAWLV